MAIIAIDYTKNGLEGNQINMLKKPILRVVSTVITVVLVVIIVFGINYGVADSLIIDDACKYDSSEISHGFIFDLFYEISSTTGYHPEPSNFNFGFTIVFGVIFGAFVSYNLIWKTKSSNIRS